MGWKESLSEGAPDAERKKEAFPPQSKETVPYGEVSEKKWRNSGGKSSSGAESIRGCSLPQERPSLGRRGGSPSLGRKKSVSQRGYMEGGRSGSWGGQKTTPRHGHPRKKGDFQEDLKETLAL